MMGAHRRQEEDQEGAIKPRIPSPQIRFCPAASRRVPLLCSALRLPAACISASTQTTPPQSILHTTSSPRPSTAHLSYDGLPIAVPLIPGTRQSSMLTVRLGTTNYIHHGPNLSNSASPVFTTTTLLSQWLQQTIQYWAPWTRNLRHVC